METIELKRLRMKQLALTNVFIIAYLVLFYFVIFTFKLSLPMLFLVLGVFLFVTAVIGTLKGESTNRLIPVFEEVAIYEKEKMGTEWRKQRKTNYFSQYILSGLMFLQYFLNRGVDYTAFPFDYTFILIVAVITLIILNIGQLFHFRKVDRAVTPNDLKGYTRKANIRSVVIGFFLGIFIFVLIFLFVISI